MSQKSKAAAFVEETYNINVTGRHLLVTDSMKDYAIEKISKIERFSNRIIDVVVTMDVQKLEHKVDIVMQVDHIKIKSHAISDDMYTSIDKAIRKIETQLLRYKEKIQDHHGMGRAVLEMNVNVLKSLSDQEIMDINYDIEDENRKRLMDRYHPHRIVSREMRPLKTLTDGEAIMKMDLSGDDFLIYRSEENLLLKVIYKRHDGHYAVIEPQF